MKTSSYYPSGIKEVMMVAILFGLPVHVLISGNPSVDSPVKRQLLTCVACSLIPSVNLAEAFSEALSILAPTTPGEATFDEEIPVPDMDLFPVTPSEASFEDGPETTSAFAFKNLAPVIPHEADFD